MRVVGCLSSSSRISEERCESLYSGVRGRRERERARERDQFGGKTSSVGSGPGARQAGKLRKLPHRERERGERDNCGDGDSVSSIRRGHHLSV